MLADAALEPNWDRRRFPVPKCQPHPTNSTAITYANPQLRAGKEFNRPEIPHNRSDVYGERFPAILANYRPVEAINSAEPTLNGG